METKPIQFLYNINRMEAVNLIATIHIDDYDTRFLEIVPIDDKTPLVIQGATVTARFVTRKNSLLSDNVACTVTDKNTIIIPIAAAAVHSVACDVKIEVNIVNGTDVLTLPFPLWVRVRGSILDNATVTPESKGTVPDLLREVKAELERVRGYVQVFIGDTEPSDPNIVLWVDTSGGEPTPGATNPVTNLTGTATANSVTLSWQASSNATSYKIYQGNNLIDSTANTTYVVNGLAADTTYTFGVVATGAGGDSTKVTVTLTTQEGGGGQLPAEYQEVEYVQPVGIANQINTGIENSVIAKIEMGLYNNYSKFMKITGAATNSSWAQSDTPYIRTESALVENSPLVGVGYTNCSISPVSSEYVGQTKYVDFIFTVSSSETNYFTFGNDLAPNNNTEEARIYYVKLYNSSNEIIAHYVPCYRMSDAKVGMYDLINDEFLIPVFGDFQKGGDV